MNIDISFALSSLFSFPHCSAFAFHELNSTPLSVDSLSPVPLPPLLRQTSVILQDAAQELSLLIKFPDTLLLL